MIRALLRARLSRKHKICHKYEKLRVTQFKLFQFIVLMNDKIGKNNTGVAQSTSELCSFLVFLEISILT